MTMETQTFADLLVLGMTDAAVIQSIESHISIGTTEGLAEHFQVATELITALNNMYENGSYAKYKQHGTMPSE